MGSMQKFPETWGTTNSRTMAPVVGKTSDSASARAVGSATAGVLELVLFHPVDTVAKRLMSNKSSLPYSQIVFKDKAAAPLGTRLLSLFPGLGYAAYYKITQRVYKFGGQPFFNDFLNNSYRSSFVDTFGEKNGKAIMQATAGSMTGIGEVVLLPLDVLKIKRQTNPEAFRSRGFMRIVADEGFGLYRGASWTVARNAPGSFALFGGSAVVKEYVFHTDYRTVSWYQNFVASVAGAVASISVSQPLDVIKTRIQNQNFESKQSGLSVVRELIKNEGMSAFFKGLTPKILIVGPKLVMGYSVAQSLIPLFGRYM